MRKSLLVLVATFAMTVSVSAAEVSNYYVVGNFTEWKPKAEYSLVSNTANIETNELMILNVELKTTYQFKIAKSADGINIDDSDWYPSGMGNAYGEHGEITADGKYDIYFRPNGDGEGEGWHEKYIYVVPSKTTGIDGVSAKTDVKAKKIIENGQIYILRGDKKFNAFGVEVK